MTAVHGQPLLIKQNIQFSVEEDEKYGNPTARGCSLLRVEKLVSQSVVAVARWQEQAKNFRLVR